MLDTISRELRTPEVRTKDKLSSLCLHQPVRNFAGAWIVAIAISCQSLQAQIPQAQVFPAQVFPAQTSQAMDPQSSDSAGILHLAGGVQRIARVAADDELPESLDRLNKSKGSRTQEEMDEIRYRAHGPYERENDRILKELAPLAKQVKESTFEVIASKYWVSMGVVISAEGYALTKASEIEDETDIKCRFNKNFSVTAEIVKIDKANDIALLKLAAGTYKPVTFANNEPVPGTILLTVGVRKDVVAMGVCSCESRSLIERGRGLLGVMPSETQKGILVSEVQNAARRAGIKDGDIIFQVQGRKVSKVPEFVNMIRRYQAGDELTVHTLRGDQEIVFKVVLGGQRIRGGMAPRFEAMNMLGTINSKRSTAFPWALQHDTPLMPEQCGGPLINLDGEVIGINIARGGRIKSFAVAGEQLEEVIQSFEIPKLSQPTTTPK